MPSSSTSETPFRQTDLGPALYPEFPLIALFRFAEPLLSLRDNDWYLVEKLARKIIFAGSKFLEEDDGTVSSARYYLASAVAARDPREAYLLAEEIDAESLKSQPHDYLALLCLKIYVGIQVVGRSKEVGELEKRIAEEIPRLFKSAWEISRQTEDRLVQLRLTLYEIFALGTVAGQATASKQIDAWYERCRNLGEEIGSSPSGRRKYEFEMLLKEAKRIEEGFA